MAPELVTADDIVEFDLDSNAVKDPGVALYLERYIHGEIFKSRPEINAVVHNHSPSVIPFGVTTVPLRPLFNTGAFIGEGVPTFEIRDFQESGDLIIKTPHLGDSLAKTLGAKPAALMRGHGAVVVGESLMLAVVRSVYLELLREAADAGDADRRPRRRHRLSRRARSRRHQRPPGLRRHLEAHLGPVVHQGAGADRHGTEGEAAAQEIRVRGRTHREAVLQIPWAPMIVDAPFPVENGPTNLFARGRSGGPRVSAAVLPQFFATVLKSFDFLDFGLGDGI